MLNLVTQTNQELEIIDGVFINRARSIAKATLQFPVLLGAMACFVIFLPLLRLFKIAVVNALGPIVSMEEVCPRDHHEDDKSLGLEFDERVVENLDCAQG
jgi:hypothetical protein